MHFILLLWQTYSIRHRHHLNLSYEEKWNIAYQYQMPLSALSTCKRFGTTCICNSSSAYCPLPASFALSRRNRKRRPCGRVPLTTTVAEHKHTAEASVNDLLNCPLSPSVIPLSDGSTIATRDLPTPGRLMPVGSTRGHSAGRWRVALRKQSHLRPARDKRYPSVRGESERRRVAESHLSRQLSGRARCRDS